jgi:hypothetical protein
MPFYLLILRPLIYKIHEKMTFIVFSPFKTEINGSE